MHRASRDRPGCNRIGRWTALQRQNGSQDFVLPSGWGRLEVSILSDLRLIRDPKR